MSRKLYRELVVENEGPGAASIRELLCGGCRYCGHQFDRATLLATQTTVRGTTREKATAEPVIQEQTLAYRLGKWIGRQGQSLILVALSDIQPSYRAAGLALFRGSASTSL